MSRLRWFVGLLVTLAVVTCLSVPTEHRNTAFASDAPADLRKRIETLEARVASLEVQILRTTRTLPAPSVPKQWSQREFNGLPVYIIPLGGAEAKN